MVDMTMQEFLYVRIQNSVCRMKHWKDVVALSRH